jgi:hypothetical protein
MVLKPIIRERSHDAFAHQVGVNRAEAWPHMVPPKVEEVGRLTGVVWNRRHEIMSSCRGGRQITPEGRVPVRRTNTLQQRRPMEEVMNRLKPLQRAAGLFVCAILGAMSTIPPALAASPAAKPAVSAEANAALEQMGKTLASKQFSFQARTLRVYADENGKFLHIGHTLKVLVRRPDRLRVDVTGDDGATQLYYDGSTLVVYGLEKNSYISVPAPNTIDKMMAEASRRMGIDFPLADFLSETPSKSLMSGVTASEVAHDVTIDGVPCRHLLFTQPPGIEIELWVEKTEQSLPRRLFVTYRSVPGQPNFIAEFSDWNLAAAATDADFVFKPPEGAKQVEPTAASTTPPGKAKGGKQ